MKNWLVRFFTLILVCHLAGMPVLNAATVKTLEQPKQDTVEEKFSTFNVVLFYAGAIGVAIGAFCSWTYFLKPENREPTIIQKNKGK